VYLIVAIPFFQKIGYNMGLKEKVTEEIVSISPVRKVEPEEMVERLAKKIHKEQS